LFGIDLGGSGVLDERLRQRLSLVLYKSKSALITARSDGGGATRCLGSGGASNWVLQLRADIARSGLVAARGCRGFAARGLLNRGSA